MGGNNTYFELGGAGLCGYLVGLVYLVGLFVWLVWFVLFVSCIEPKKPDKQEKPNEPEEPKKPALSSGCLWLNGIGGFGLVLHRARFGGGCDRPCIEEDGDQHVAHDELPVAHAS
ncbi:MAG: hypothetical protein KGJ82_21010 [Nitrospirota bacterium]|nr:hypothetical protein [Nitrospirota bacterium]